MIMCNNNSDYLKLYTILHLLGNQVLFSYTHIIIANRSHWKRRARSF